MTDAAPPVPVPSRSRESRIRGAIRRHGEAIQNWLDTAAGRSEKAAGVVEDEIRAAAAARVLRRGTRITWEELTRPDPAFDGFVRSLTGHDIPLHGMACGFRPGHAVEGVVRALAEADPTDCGTYVDWAVRTWLARHWRHEDLARTRDDLTLFDRVRHRLEGEGARDIGRYASTHDLLQVVRPFRARASGDVLRDRPEMLEAPHARVVRDDARYQVVMPLTAEAAAFWGDGSEWCITWGVPGSRHPERRNRFEDYAKSGPFLFVRRRADATLWAFHLVGGAKGVELWDQDDRPVRDGLARLLSPEWEGLLDAALLDVLDGPVPTVRPLAAMDGERRSRLLHVARAVPHIDSTEWVDATPEDRMLGISVFPRLVAFLRETTDTERRTAIGLDPGVVTMLDHATSEERVLALRGRPALISEMRHPTEAERLVALEGNPMLLYRLAPLNAAERATVIGLRPDLADVFLPLPDKSPDKSPDGGFDVRDRRRGGTGVMPRGMGNLCTEAVLDGSPPAGASAMPPSRAGFPPPVSPREAMIRLGRDWGGPAL